MVDAHHVDVSAGQRRLCGVLFPPTTYPRTTSTSSRDFVPPIGCPTPREDRRVRALRARGIDQREIHPVRPQGRAVLILVHPSGSQELGR